MQVLKKAGGASISLAGINCARLRARRPRSQQWFAVVLVILLAVIASSCKPFKVKPRIEVPRAANEAQAETDGVAFRASVVRDEDWLNDTFDANLILAGIVPVRVELKNARKTPVELRKARFELKTASGRTFGSADAGSAFKQALSYYELSAWSKALYKESRADFASYALDTKAPAAAGESRQGLIYFLLRGDSASDGGFTLVISKIESSDAKSAGRVELKLD
jgi:hypothetical protein